MNKYKCFHIRHQPIDVEAMTTYEAQCLAAKKLKIKPKSQYQISVMLGEKDGVPVMHSGAELPGA